MWILEVFAVGGFVRQVLLVAGQFTIGRKATDLVLPDDPSISRHHLTLTVLPVGAAALNDVAHVPVMLISDMSKHGTFVNGDRVVNTGDKHRVTNGDTISLGGRDAARMIVRYAPIVAVISRTLSPEETKVHQALIAKLGGCCLLNELPDIRVLREARISPLIVAFVSKRISNETSAMLALMNRYVLVNPEYFPAVHELVFNSPSTTVSTLPRPFNYEAERDPLLKDVPYFRPEPSLYGVNEFVTSDLRPAEQLFRHVHFLTIAEPLFMRYEHVIEFGGGASSCVKSDDVLNWAADMEEWFAAASVERRRSESNRPAGSQSPNRGHSSPPKQAPIPITSTDANVAEIERRHEEQRRRYLPLQSLPGVNKLFCHGLNTWVVVGGDEFVELIRHLETTFGESSYKHALMQQLREAKQNTTKPPFQGEDLVEVAKRMDAYVALWKMGYSLVHEDNILLATYSGEATPHLMPNAPGVLNKKEMAPPAPDADELHNGDDDSASERSDDSEATVENLGEAVAAIASARSRGVGPKAAGSARKTQKLAEREARITSAFRRSIGASTASPTRRTSSSPTRARPKETPLAAGEVILCQPQQLFIDPAAVQQAKKERANKESASAARAAAAAVVQAVQDSGLVLSRQTSTAAVPADQKPFTTTPTATVPRTSNASSDNSDPLYAAWCREIANPTPFLTSPSSVSITATPFAARRTQLVTAERHRSRERATASVVSTPEDKAVIAMCHRFSAPLMAIEHQVFELGRSAVQSSSPNRVEFDVEQSLRLAQERVRNFLVCLTSALRNDRLVTDAGTLRDGTSVVVDDMRRRIHLVLGAISAVLRAGDETEPAANAVSSRATSQHRLSSPYRLNN